MANFMDEFKVPTAITDSTKLDLGHQHITTANFMQINPILCKEMVPGEKVDVNMMTFSRMQPLAVPTFGRANIKERAFFVPMRTIWHGWNDFITDTPHVTAGVDTAPGTDSYAVSLTRVPFVRNYDLIQAFLYGTIMLDGVRGFVTSVWSPGDGGNEPGAGAYDIVYNTVGDLHYYYKLTSYGRQLLKVLESLGYKIIWEERNEDVYSALPLYALIKVICDWYFPSQYVNSEIYQLMMHLLNLDVTGLGNGEVGIGWNHIAEFASLCLYANYDSDYFVSAWDSPSAPAPGLFSVFSIPDITGTSLRSSIVTNGLLGQNGTYGNTNGTPFIGQAATSGGPNNAVISEYVLHSLHALTDYMKRHQLVGARAMDRYLARYGKSLDDAKLDRCNYISSKMVPLQIGDVLNVADTTRSVLGSFAGKGMAFEKSFNFDWTTNEFGYLIIISTIIPAAGIYQGLDRKVMHKSRMDFWTPEFDNLGVQAISTRELYNPTGVDMLKVSASTNAYCGFNDNVFGFAPRYGEYKYCNDQLTGDFVCDTMTYGNSQSSAWHLMRTFDFNDCWNGVSYSFNSLKHGRDFVQGLGDHVQYSRIFTYYNPTYDGGYQPDPFTMIYDFNMVSFSPMKPLYDTYEFEDEGKQVTEQVNGVKVN